MGNIPKKIHYIWFGGGELNKKFEVSLKSWQAAYPDYEIKRWDETNYDLKNAPKYVSDAYESGLYALVSDYVRLDILYREGGWYMDTDTVILKPFFDRYSEYNFVAPIEDTRVGQVPEILKYYYHDQIDDKKRRVNDDGFVSCVSIMISLMGAQPGIQYLKDLMELYDKIDFKKRDYPGCLFGGPIGPQIYARALEKYGFVYDGVEQDLDDNMFIFGSEVMRNGIDDKTYDGRTCAVHLCTFSWFKKFLEQNNSDMTLTLPDGTKLKFNVTGKNKQN